MIQKFDFFLYFEEKKWKKKFENFQKNQKNDFFLKNEGKIKLLTH